MLALKKLILVTYDLHEPYDYTKLWQLLRDEGFDDHIPAEDGSRVALPMSVWAKAASDDVVKSMRDDISDRLTMLCEIDGLKARLMVLVCDNWAWRITNPSPALDFNGALSGILDKYVRSA